MQSNWNLYWDNNKHNCRKFPPSFQLEKFADQFLFGWQVAAIQSRDFLNVFHFKRGGHQKADN